MYMRAKSGWLTGLLTGCAAVVLSTGAMAGPYVGANTTWQDNSVESLGFDAGPSAGCPTCAIGQLDVGDTLRGILRIPTVTVNGVNQGPPGSGSAPDLVAIFETQVLTKTAAGGSVTY